MKSTTGFGSFGPVGKCPLPSSTMTVILPLETVNPPAQLGPFRQGGIRAATTIEEWTEALSELIADPAAAERMGMAGRELAVARYSVAALAPRLAALLRRLT